MRQFHILVIEDDLATYEYVEVLLTMEDYSVSRWPTSHQAVEHVAERQPDLVLLDNRLGPPPDGWEIFQILRSLPTTTHIPILLYSAEPMVLHKHEDEIRTMHGDVLEKPFYPDQLLAKIEALTLLSNER